MIYHLEIMLESSSLHEAWQDKLKSDTEGFYLAFWKNVCGDLWCNDINDRNTFAARSSTIFPEYQ